MPDPVTLIQTSDLHGKFPDESANRIRAERDASPNPLLVDSGDAAGAGNLGLRPHEPAFEVLGSLGYAAMALGNREAHLWQSVLEKKLAPLRLPVLCANLRCARPPGPVRPSLLVARGGARIAFFGLTVPMITGAMWCRHLTDLLFEDPTATARALVPQLRAGADLVVLLSHLGLKEDLRLAARVPGIDLILGGHSHIETHSPERANGTLVLQPGGWGRFFTRVDVGWEGRRPQLAGRLLTLSPHDTAPPAA